MTRTLGKSIGLLGVILLGLCVAGGATAQSWSDKLKSAAGAEADQAAQPATDKIDRAEAKADEASAKAERAGEMKDEAAAKATAVGDTSVTDTAKRAAGKGVSTASDSLVGGASTTAAAKKGGGAAVQEALKAGGSETPAVSAPGEAATD